jgi:hypothetical protein
VRWAFLGLMGLFLLLQLVPYGRDHTNPPVTSEAPWPDTATRAHAVRACYDCHTNETVWGWYTNIAPASWLSQHDVMGGREKLNFSEWDREQDHADKAAQVVLEGSMPPLQYLLLHPGARLSDQEKRMLAAALDRIGGGGGGPGSG